MLTVLPVLRAQRVLTHTLWSLELLVKDSSTDVSSRMILAAGSSLTVEASSFVGTCAEFLYKLDP